MCMYLGHYLLCIKLFADDDKFVILENVGKSKSQITNLEYVFTLMTQYSDNNLFYM